MILVLKNYPSVVSAEAMLVRSEWSELLDHSMQFVNSHPSEATLPKYIANDKVAIVGVTFDDADEAIRDVYNVDWSQCVHYGDMVIVGMRDEISNIPDGVNLVASFVNDSGESLVVILKISKALDHTMAKNNAAMQMFYCPVGISPSERDAKTFTIINLIKNDENLLANEALLQICSIEPYSGKVFSSSSM